MILSLSHPYGNSVNSHVDADNFDGSTFVLTFPTINDTAHDIVGSSEDKVLFKVDVARAFRNLRVDPFSCTFNAYYCFPSKTFSYFSSLCCSELF